MNDINTEQHIVDFTGTQFYVRNQCLGTSMWGDALGLEAIELHKWHHVAITRYNTKISLFVDGVNTTPIPGTANVDPSTKLMIGHIYGTAYPSHYFLNGKIDNVKIYDRPLSENEIKFNFDVEKNNDV